MKSRNKWYHILFSFSEWWTNYHREILAPWISEVCRQDFLFSKTFLIKQCLWPFRQRWVTVKIWSSKSHLPESSLSGYEIRRASFISGTAGDLEQQMANAGNQGYQSTISYLVEALWLNTMISNTGRIAFCGNNVPLVWNWNSKNDCKVVQPVHKKPLVGGINAHKIAWLSHQRTIPSLGRASSLEPCGQVLPSR